MWEHFEQKQEEEKKQLQKQEQQWEEEKASRGKKSRKCCCWDVEDPERQRLVFSEESEGDGRRTCCEWFCEVTGNPWCPVAVIGVAFPLIIGVWILVSYL